MFRTPMTLDARQRTFTAIAMAILVVAGLSVLRTGKVFVVVPSLFFLGVLVAVVWAMSPCGLEIDHDELRVLRRAWVPLSIPRNAVESASAIDSLGRGTLRLFGVGGFFGSYGLFSNSDLGRFRMYATRSGQSVLVRRSDGQLPLVLTPDDVNGAIGVLGRHPESALSHGR
jgi:hypothetical protein